MSLLTPRSRRAVAAALTIGLAALGTVGPSTSASAAPSRDPMGSFDTATGGEGTVTVSGWAIDPDTSASIDVHVYVGSAGYNLGRAATPRPDVARAVRRTTNTYGFSTTLTGVSAGSHNVCAFAINVGRGANRLLGCRTVTVSSPSSPIGNVDAAVPAYGRLTLTGWAIDPDAATTSIEVHAYIGSRGWNLGAAAGSRPDLAGPFPAAGTAHGFSTTITGVPSGTQNVCLFGINVNAGSNRIIGCRSVTVPDGSPTGVLDSVVTGPDGVVDLSGWSFDPDSAAGVEVHAYFGSVGYSLGSPSVARADVRTATGAATSTLGFSTRLRGVAGGTHRLCLFAINTGSGSNSQFDCRTVTVPGGNPFGVLDYATYNAGTVLTGGWAIDPDVTGAIEVDISVNGVALRTTAANNRPDLAVGYPAYGGAHGFTQARSVTLPAGTHQVCATAVNVGTGANASLGCRTITV